MLDFKSYLSNESKDPRLNNWTEGKDDSVNVPPIISPPRQVWFDFVCSLELTIDG